MVIVDGVAGSSVPADDRGLAYGDGVFETIAVIDGTPALWDQHYKRLGDGCQHLGFHPPAATTLRDEIQWLAGEGSGVARVTITRGSGGRGYRAPEEPEPRRLVSLFEFPHYPIGHWQDGVEVRLCSTRLPYRPDLGGFKHLNRLEQVLARSEWGDPAIPEGLMAPIDGEAPIAGTISNVVARFGANLVTPPVRGHGVEGVMRDHILGEGERIGWTVRSARLALDELAAADELFVTNSVIGLWPVRDLAGRAHWLDWKCSQEMLARLTGAGIIPDWLGKGA